MSETRTAHLAMKLPGGRIEVDVEVPAGPARVGQVVPLARALADRMVELAVIQVERTGEHVSCRAGCGACCRQLVPISEAEAREVARLVEALPEPRRGVIRDRFAEARRRLEEAGLLDALQRSDAMDLEERRAVGLEYFRQQIACPFLEEESCSIHPERPISCREYLVTSPAEACRWRQAGVVRGVPMASSVWKALARLDEPREGAAWVRWVPLSLAPSWSESHPEGPPSRTGPEILRDLIGHLTGRDDLPDPPSPAPQLDASPG